MSSTDPPKEPAAPAAPAPPAVSPSREDWRLTWLYGSMTVFLASGAALLWTYTVATLINDRYVSQFSADGRMRWEVISFLLLGLGVVMAVIPAVDALSRGDEKKLGRLETFWKIFGVLFLASFTLWYTSEEKHKAAEEQQKKDSTETELKSEELRARQVKEGLDAQKAAAEKEQDRLRGEAQKRRDVLQALMACDMSKAENRHSAISLIGSFYKASEESTSGPDTIIGEYLFSTYRSLPPDDKESHELIESALNGTPATLKAAASYHQLAQTDARLLKASPGAAQAALQEQLALPASELQDNLLHGSLLTLRKASAQPDSAVSREVAGVSASLVKKALNALLLKQTGGAETTGPAATATSSTDELGKLSLILDKPVVSIHVGRASLLDRGRALERHLHPSYATAGEVQDLSLEGLHLDEPTAIRWFGGDKAAAEKTAASLKAEAEKDFPNARFQITQASTPATPAGSKAPGYYEVWVSPFYGMTVHLENNSGKANAASLKILSDWLTRRGAICDTNQERRLGGNRVQIQLRPEDLRWVQALLLQKSRQPAKDGLASLLQAQDRPVLFKEATDPIADEMWLFLPDKP